MKCITNITSAIVYLVLVCLLSQSCDKETDKIFKIQFDNTKKVSGQKFAIKDISPGLETDWSDYNFVVLEMKVTTSQRFQVGFTTDKGYNEIRVMSYAPNAWIKQAIPLKFYTQLPDPANDIAGTMNQPRYTGWFNLGGKRGPLKGVDSIGIRMHVPIGNPSIEIRNMSLHKNDPGDEYLGKTPIVDEFGQSNLVDFEEKIKSINQLESEWNLEDESLNRDEDFNYSKYGGYLNAKLEATGFFRTQKVDNNWWFVDPDGYQFLSLGSDCIAPGNGGNVNRLDKRSNFMKQAPPEGMGLNPKRPNRVSFGTWNLFRRFGEDYPTKSNDMIIRRMTNWGLNTIANWSSSEVIKMNQKPFMLQLRGLGIGESIMGLTDVYDVNFQSHIEKAVQEYVTPYKDNPWLIGYFTGNEPSWLGQESRLCDLILNSTRAMPIQSALKNYLANGDSPERRKAFIYDSFKTFLQTVEAAVRKHDPNHLTLGIRFGKIPENEVLEICKEVFDVFSFNCYELAPPKKDMDRVMNVTGLPMIIGEYHAGTVNRGMAQALVQVENQKERGVAYRYYTEQAFNHPSLIGVGYFQWSDQDLTGRGYDGENYNCGLVDVTDRPYKHMVTAIKETAKRIYDVHVDKIEPYNKIPLNPCGYELIPDLWNE
ncbi:MAG: hypothetical protein P8K68_10090 [Algibacter sp.]|uniref:hypothetical protein n=1 Tax=Algibacter sp. TaxID=1872428 RepID=UPI002608A90C|nr:hypothetical protein [Algibacter sp.]MDG1730240.1 hypothetical protein [Algibacter sp.]MDG2179119.1 hypothetical protein [Algibacter sp.]